MKKPTPRLEPPPTLLYSRKMADQSLSISIRYVDVLIADGHIETVRIGRRVLVRYEELSRFANSARSYDIMYRMPKAGAVK
jgi:excisionase family DNA binding protein